MSEICAMTDPPHNSFFRSKAKSFFCAEFHLGRDRLRLPRYLGGARGRASRPTKARHTPQKETVSFTRTRPNTKTRSDKGSKQLDSLSLLKLPVLQRPQRIQIELHRSQRAVGADKVGRVARSGLNSILHSRGRVFL